MNKIYGASDDLLELEGEISDEVNEIDKPFLFYCSDGTRGNFTYTEAGLWKCTITAKGNLFKQLIQAVGEDIDHTGEAKGCSSYSDVLLLNMPLSFIKVNGKYYRPIR